VDGGPVDPVVFSGAEPDWIIAPSIGSAGHATSGTGFDGTPVRPGGS
jgi:hypothetical protein